MSNKTSDKNVVTEEDLEVLNEVLLHHRETEQARIAIEHMLAEREQMLKERDVANDSVIAHKFAVMQQQINEKDKRIQEMEKENTKYKNSFNQQVEILKDTIKKLNESIPKQVVIDLIANETIDISGFECIAVEDLQELLEGGK